MSIILKLKTTRKNLDQKEGQRGGAGAEGRGARGCDEWEEAEARSGRTSSAWLRSLGLILTAMGSITGKGPHLSFLKDQLAGCPVENGLRLWKNW